MTISLHGPDLTTISNRYFIRELKARIVNGEKNMTAFDSILTKEEVNNIVAFLALKRFCKNKESYY